MGMSKLYKQRPSEFMGITDDEYTAYCLDQACAHIIAQRENEKEPQFKSEYQSFREMYSQYQQE